MKTVRVKRENLIETLEKNMKTHIEEYNKAYNEYRAAAEKALIEKLEEFKAMKTDEIRINHLPPPVSHEGDYEDNINMLKMSCDDVIELEQHEAQNLLLDNWQWSEDLHTTRAMYAKFMH